MNHLYSFAALSIAIWISSTTSATVIQTQSQNEWLASVDAYARIRFSEFPENTFITTQYQHQGITFTDGVDQIDYSNTFLNDGRGLNGAFDSISVRFDQPTYAIGVDFPGTLQIRLFNQGHQFFESTFFGTAPTGNFGGLISDQPFDSVQILDYLGGVFIDDLYFDPPIPAPPSIALLAALCIRGRRRRR